jgi:hypothetical protein
MRSAAFIAFIDSVALKWFIDHLSLASTSRSLGSLVARLVNWVIGQENKKTAPPRRWFNSDLAQDFLASFNSEQTSGNGEIQLCVQSFYMCAAQHSGIGAISLRERVGYPQQWPSSYLHWPVCSDYKDDGTNILLDANENAYGPGLELNTNGELDGISGHGGVDIDLLGLNRYPDPYVMGKKSSPSHPLTLSLVINTISSSSYAISEILTTTRPRQ